MAGIEMLDGELCIPKHLVKSQSGFSFDIGGSLMKLAYFCCQPGENLGQEDTVTIHLRTYDPEDVEEALEFLKEKLKDDIKRKVTTCGMGCMYKSEVIKKFNIDFETVSEMDCFVKAFYFLSTKVDQNLIIQPKIKEALELAEKQYEEAVAILENVIKARKPDTPDEDERRAFPRFPCLIAIFGSGGCFIKVEENGEYTVVEGHNRTGRTFRALSSLILGTSDFNEILELASHGDNKAVDSVYQDAQGATDSDDLYAKTCPSGGLFFALGKAQGQKIDDFRREDLARSLLVTECCDLAQVTHLTARAHGIQDVYVTGSLISHPLVQYEFTKFMQIRTTFNPKDKIRFELLRHAGYYGALGALIQGNMNIPESQIDMAASTYTLAFLGVLCS